MSSGGDHKNQHWPFLPGSLWFTFSWTSIRTLASCVAPPISSSLFFSGGGAAARPAVRTSRPWNLNNKSDGKVDPRREEEEEEEVRLFDVPAEVEAAPSVWSWRGIEPLPRCCLQQVGNTCREERAALRRADGAGPHADRWSANRTWAEFTWTFIQRLITEPTETRETTQTPEAPPAATNRNSPHLSVLHTCLTMMTSDPAPAQNHSNTTAENLFRL